MGEQWRRGTHSIPLIVPAHPGQRLGATGSASANRRISGLDRAASRRIAPGPEDSKRAGMVQQTPGHRCAVASQAFVGTGARRLAAATGRAATRDRAGAALESGFVKGQRILQRDIARVVDQQASDLHRVLRQHRQVLLLDTG